MFQKMKLKRREVTLYNKIKTTILLFSIVPVICIMVVSIPAAFHQKQNLLREEVRKQMVELVNDMNYDMNTIEVLAKTVLTDDYLSFQVNQIISDVNISDYDKFRFKTQTMSIIRVILSVNQIKAARIHIEKDGIQEYPSQIYNMDRAKISSWYEERNEIPFSGKWYMDVTDDQKQNVYDGYFCADNMASYVVPFKIGNSFSSNFEIVIPMEEIIPDLYTENQNEDNILIDGDGKLYGVNEDSVFGNITVEKLEEYLGTDSLETYAENGVSVTNVWMGYQPVVIAISKSPSRDLTFVRMVSIREEMMTILVELGMGLLVGAIILIAILIVINRIVQHLLADFKVFRRCLQEVGKGNLDIKIPPLRQVEINEIAVEYNQMLTNVKELTAESIRREVMIKDAQLKSLEKQIDSHFLYNVLDSIKMMAEIEGMHNISSSLLALAKMFRYNLQTKYHDVFLQDEIEYLENYIKLSNIRFDYYINLSQAIDDEVRNIKVPKMILQPIVENSIDYGLDELAEDTTIYLKAYIQEGTAFVEVSDMGKGMDEPTLEKVRRSVYEEVEEEKSSKVKSHGSNSGIGLRNIHERIQLMYGKNYGIEIYSQLNCYTKIVLRIPAFSSTEGKKNLSNGVHSK